MLRKLEQKLKNLPLVSKQNLAVILDKKGTTLDYWTKKMVDKGVLIKLKSGVYAPRYYVDMVSQNPEDTERYREYIVNQLRSPSYLSLEYVLSKNNILAEAVFKVTSCTTKSTRTYETELGVFIYRSIKEELFTGYLRQVWRDKQIWEATPEKALQDWQYLNAGADVSRIQYDAWLTTP